MTVKRKLTTILCADVVGYSRLMGVDEPGTLKRLKDCRELMAQFIERHHGRVISWTGDAVLAEFSSVVEAVQCAIEVQRDLGARNERMKPDERMEFRIGLNLGDVMVEEHDIFGEGVNIAARLQSIAPKGGILISGSVYEQVRNKLTVGFNFMGHQQVKNIADHVPAYVVRHNGMDGDAIGVAAFKGSGSAGPSGAAMAGTRARGAHPVPGASPLTRVAAAGVDWAAALAATAVLGLAVEAAAPGSFDLSPGFGAFASDRVIASEDPSTEILNGGALVIVREPAIVERSFLGLAVQTLRVTQATIQETPAVGSAKPVTRTATVETLVDPRSRQALAAPALLWVLPAVYLLLVAGFEGLGSGAASPGKRLFGLKVARSNGRDSGLFTALIRNAAKIVAALPLLAGFLMALWTRQRQGLHDWFADAVVTRK